VAKRKEIAGSKLILFKLTEEVRRKGKKETEEGRRKVSSRPSSLYVA